MNQPMPASYAPPPTNYISTTANHGPTLVPTHNYIPSSHQPTYGYSPHIPYSGTQQAPLYPQSHVHGSANPKASERFVTYYPYTRYYTDYEEQVVMVPV